MTLLKPTLVKILVSGLLPLCHVQAQTAGADGGIEDSSTSGSVRETPPRLFSRQPKSESLRQSIRDEHRAPASGRVINARASICKNGARIASYIETGPRGTYEVVVTSWPSDWHRPPTVVRTEFDSDPKYISEARAAQNADHNQLVRDNGGSI